jgi:DNA-directed RNA polymerase subunit alpha
VKIDGAVHEFTSLPNVAEDVTDIILNLKEVIVRSHDGKPRTLRIEKDGDGKITAGDIQCPEGVEVLNPDKVVMTCSKGAKVRMELEVGTGRGYVPAERNKPPTWRSAWSPSTRSSRPSRRSTSRSPTPASASRPTTTV